MSQIIIYDWWNKQNCVFESDWVAFTCALSRIRRRLYWSETGISNCRKPPDFRRMALWNAKIAAIAVTPGGMSGQSVVSSRETRAFFRIHGLRGRTFRHDLQRASWKVLVGEDPASVPRKMNFIIAKERQRARRSRYGQEFANYVIIGNRNRDPRLIVKHSLGLWWLCSLNRQICNSTWLNC